VKRKAPRISDQEWKDYLQFVKALIQNTGPELRELMDDYGGPENVLFIPFYDVWG
jgi:hypothetical protein